MPGMARTLPEYQFDVTVRRFVALVKLLGDGDLAVDVPYQRQSVWTTEQQVNLIRSLQIGLPIPSVLLADRGVDEAAAGRAQYVVVDGRQRVEALTAWFDGTLRVPASYIDDDWLQPSLIADDGTVSRHDLTDVGDRMWQTRWLVPVNTVKGLTVAEEADLYLLTNFGGVAQTDADHTRARTFASPR